MVVFATVRLGLAWCDKGGTKARGPEVAAFDGSRTDGYEWPDHDRADCRGVIS